MCNILVTFNTAFTSVPNSVSSIFVGTNTTVAHTEYQLPAGTASFESDAGQTWTSMPAAATELYGKTNNRVAIDLTSIVSVLFSANCVNAGSNSGTAVLQPQYSTDSGATWTDLAAVAGNLNLGVGTQSVCSFFTGGTPVSVGGPPVDGGSIATGAKQLGVWLRVVGIHGGGVGDNPSFNNIQLSLYEQSFQSGVACIPTRNLGLGYTAQSCNLSGCAAGGDCSQCSNAGVTFVTVSKMCIQVSIDAPPFSAFQVAVSWTAYLCVKGGSTC